MWNLRKLSRQNFHNNWDNFSLKINSRMLLFYHWINLIQLVMHVFISGYVQFLKLRYSNVSAKLTTSHNGNLCPHQLRVVKNFWRKSLSIDRPTKKWTSFIHTSDKKWGIWTAEIVDVGRPQMDSCRVTDAVWARNMCTPTYWFVRISAARSRLPGPRSGKKRKNDWKGRFGAIRKLRDVVERVTHDNRLAFHYCNVSSMFLWGHGHGRLISQFEPLTEWISCRFACQLSPASSEKPCSGHTQSAPVSKEARARNSRKWSDDCGLRNRCKLWCRCSLKSVKLSKLRVFLRKIFVTFYQMSVLEL